MSTQEPIREDHLPVQRTARFALLGEPGAAVREVWFVCHGYGQLAGRFLRSFLPIAGPERLFVAPEGLSRFYLGEERGPHGPDSRVGATWMTREDREAEIGDYVRWLDDLHRHVLASLQADSLRVRILGFSQGAHTVSRWVAHGEATADELILWSGTFPVDFAWEVALPRLRELSLTLASGSEDRWLTPERLRESVEEIEARGVIPRVVLFEGGHRIQEAPLRKVAGS